MAHLLQGCSQCARKVRENVRPEVPADAYEAVLSRLSGERTLRRDNSWAKLLPFEKPAAAAPAEPQLSIARR